MEDKVSDMTKTELVAPIGAVVKVEWLDEPTELKEQELLCFTTTYGELVAADDDFVVVANRLNAMDGGEATIIPMERVLKIEALA